MGYSVLLHLSVFAFTIHVGWILGGRGLFGRNQLPTSPALFNNFRYLDLSKCHFNLPPTSQNHSQLQAY
jgi:hypothetical protein